MERHDHTNAAIRERPDKPRKGFLRSEDGSLIIFGMMLFLIMLVIAGLGVDFMRAETQRARLQATLDRAVLAAGSMDQTLDPKDVVLDYFNKTGLGAYIDRDDVTVTESLTSRRVEAKARMSVGTTFLKLSGIDNLAAPGLSAAEENASQTEISLVVDVSGSMGGSSASGRTKIAELRRAAKQFTSIVLCDPTNPNATTNCTVEHGKVSVSLVPYSEQVLVGEALLGHFNPTNEHSYSSCVTFDAGDFNTMKITPTQVLKRTGHFDPYSWGVVPGGNRALTCRTDSWRKITPVSGELTNLRNAIDALGAGGNTSIDVGMKWGAAFLEPAVQPVVEDLIDEGMIHADYDGRPLGWSENNIKKVIVLMTDGVNTSQHYLADGHRAGPSPVYYYDCVEGDECYAANGNRTRRIYSIYNPTTEKYYWEDFGIWEDHAFGDGTFDVNCKTVWKPNGYGGWHQVEECDEIAESAAGTGATRMSYPHVWATRTWRWWNKFDWLSPAGGGYYNGTKNNRLQQICTAAKDEGVTIFTVGFEVTNSSANVMRQCATSPSHYFNANGTNLADAFAAIARKITKLRLVK